jgi:hypothetical protein
LGLPNVLLYAAVGSVAPWLFPVLGALAVAAVLALAVRRRADVLLGAAAAVLTWLWVAPAATPNAIALPIALLALSAIPGSSREGQAPWRS